MAGMYFTQVTLLECAGGGVSVGGRGGGGAGEEWRKGDHTSCQLPYNQVTLLQSSYFMLSLQFTLVNGKCDITYQDKFF